MKTKRRNRKRDAFGSAEGTIANHVNQFLSHEWESEEAIIKLAARRKLTRRQVMARLYDLVAKGVLTKRKFVTYKLKAR